MTLSFQSLEMKDFQQKVLRYTFIMINNLTVPVTGIEAAACLLMSGLDTRKDFQI